METEESSAQLLAVLQLLLLPRAILYKVKHMITMQSRRRIKNGIQIRGSYKCVNDARPTWLFIGKTT